MFRKLSFLLIACLLIAGFITSPAYAAKSYYAEYFDVQIDLQEGGSAIITEKVKFHFEGDPFTFVFREISADETDGITFLEASMDGVPMPQGTQAGEVEVEVGDPLEVTWHFAPTANSAHVFTVRYQADGIIRKGDADSFIWRVVPEEHEYVIERSTVTLSYPSQATALGQPTLDWNHDAVWEENHIVLTAAGIGEDEDVILTARFAADSLTQVAPEWQVQKERVAAATARGLPIGFAAGIATLILGGLGLLTYTRANGRDLNLSTITSTASPPSDISPAVVGSLTGQKHNVMGAIFDLAQRGVLEIREEEGSWGTKSYSLIRKDQTVALNPYEQGLLAALFKPGEARVKMSEIAHRLAAKSQFFSEPLEEELIRRGWLDPERKQNRTRLLMVGFLMLVLGLAGFVFSLVIGGMSLESGTGMVIPVSIAAGIGAGLFVVSILLLIYAGMYSVLTPSGEEQAARWKGFAAYLKQVSKGREPAIRPDYFERYLGYAAVFGLGANWAKYFQKLGGVPLPVWFHALAGNNANFGAFVAVMAASDSTGASTGGGGAGAGASGGGSSGAG